MQEGFFEKLTQFSLGKNVLDAQASNKDSFLFRDIYVPPTYLNSPIWGKLILPTP
jgi:hypothetical protein